MPQQQVGRDEIDMAVPDGGYFRPLAPFIQPGRSGFVFTAGDNDFRVLLQHGFPAHPRCQCRQVCEDVDAAAERDRPVNKMFAVNGEDGFMPELVKDPHGPLVHIGAAQV